MLVRKKENDVVIIGSTLHTTHADTTLGKVNTIIKILPNRSDKSGTKVLPFLRSPPLVANFGISEHKYFCSRFMFYIKT